MGYTQWSTSSLCYVKLHLDMLQLLLKHIAEIEVRDKNNKTPLHFSSLNNSTEGAQLLFQHNEGIKKSDKDNRTQLLLQHNADANAKDIEK